MHVPTEHLVVNLECMKVVLGDEFVVLLIDCSSENALQVAERLNQKIRTIHESLSIAYGITEIVADDIEHINIEQIIFSADEKMYYHKREIKELP